MRSVFSIEPEGITRACPIVPLMSRNISATQSHAMISRWTRLFNGSAPFLVFFCGSVFTVHRHRRLSGMRISRPLGVSPVRRILANFQLHKTGRINACVARGAEFSRSEEHTSELQSQSNLVCRLLLEKKKKKNDELACTAA